MEAPLAETRQAELRPGAALSRRLWPTVMISGAALMTAWRNSMRGSVHLGRAEGSEPRFGLCARYRLPLRGSFLRLALPDGFAEIRDKTRLAALAPAVSFEQFHPRVRVGRAEDLSAESAYEGINWPSRSLYEHAAMRRRLRQPATRLGSIAMKERVFFRLVTATTLILLMAIALFAITGHAYSQAMGDFTEQAWRP